MKFFHSFFSGYFSDSDEELELDEEDDEDVDEDSPSIADPSPIALISSRYRFTTGGSSVSGFVSFILWKSLRASVLTFNSSYIRCECYLFNALASSASSGLSLSRACSHLKARRFLSLLVLTHTRSKLSELAKF